MASGQGTTERGFKREPKRGVSEYKRTHTLLWFLRPQMEVLDPQSQTLAPPRHLKQEPWIYREEFLGLRGEAQNQISTREDSWGGQKRRIKCLLSLPLWFTTSHPTPRLSQCLCVCVTWPL